MDRKHKRGLRQENLLSYSTTNVGVKCEKKNSFKAMGQYFLDQFWTRRLVGAEDELGLARGGRGLSSMLEFVFAGEISVKRENLQCNHCRS